MAKLRVLFNMSKSALKTPGGGEVQLLRTKQELGRIGVHVKIFERDRDDFSGFDLFHNFSLHRDTFVDIKAAAAAGLPVAISPVYWPSLGSALLWNKGLAKKAKAFAVELINRIDFLGISSVKAIVRKADLLLPNSMAEAAMLENVFQAKPGRIAVVPNGVDKRFGKGIAGLFEKKFGLSGFALFVGRIEERKNVLPLVRAMDSIDANLVIIGDAKHGSEAYAKQCKREAGKKVLFLPSMPNESPVLQSAYAACKVFVLPSWYETPGLAALEAGLAGANIVITGQGAAKEYFQGMASYVNPASVSDIRRKILVELRKEKTKQLSRHIERNFLWRNAAEKTKAAYETVLR